MGRKVYTAEQIIGKLPEAEVVLSQGYYLPKLFSCNNRIKGTKNSGRKACVVI